MDGLGEIGLASDHPDAVAVRDSASDHEYDYRRFRTQARKTANLLSHRGVRDGRTLVVADDHDPIVLIGAVGAALTAAVLRVGSPGRFDARAVLAPVETVGKYDLPAGGQLLGYGGAPAEPSVVHFEEAMWSENPTTPPPTVSRDDPALATADRTFTHGEVLDAARSIDVGPDDALAVRAALSRPGTVAAMVAALLAGALVLFPDDESGTIGVGDGPELRSVDPASILDG